MIALAEVTLALRFINVFLGIWIAAAPWLLGGGSAWAKWNDVAMGIALILLSLPRGKVWERYGSWDAYII